jgi:hypothetical protein
MVIYRTFIRGVMARNNITMGLGGGGVQLGALVILETFQETNMLTLKISHGVLAEITHVEDEFALGEVIVAANVEVGRRCGVGVLGTDDKRAVDVDVVGVEGDALGVRHDDAQRVWAAGRALVP